jgi:23S rRNA pseudouridine2605 synthase
MRPGKKIMLTRINRFISESGITSRRKAEGYITGGRVEVNGKTVTDLSVRIDPEKDIVELDGEKITPSKHIYILLNKPSGYITSTDDEKSRKTVVDLIDTKERVYPVGRLDFNTTGVLLLTNDGEFTNLLTHPRNKVPKVYEVKLNRPLLPEDKEKLLRGVFLESGRGKFTAVHFPRKIDRNAVEITSVEGRNHFVKNMFGKLGYQVNYLNRKSFAGVEADISKGSYRFLSSKEVRDIKKKYGK